MPKVPAPSVCRTTTDEDVRAPLLPNAWDHATALALAAAGFAAVGTSSLGVAAADGKPDADGSARGETLALAAVAGRMRCPLTVDIEDGFGGGPEEIAVLCAEPAALGAAGVNLESRVGRNAGRPAIPGRRGGGDQGTRA